MSTGRRLAKRSIIGTKVCAPGPDGLWYSGVIQDVKTPPTATVTSSSLLTACNSAAANSNGTNLTADTKYIVRFDFKTQTMQNNSDTSPSTSSSKSSVIMEARRTVSAHISPAQALRRNAMIKEFRESDLIGPGFRSILGIQLQPGQRVFLTHNGRETSGDVIAHDVDKDEVVVKITTIGTEEPIELKKRLEEVRLLESRRSARLADQERDTDFARLADMGGDRRRTTSHSIEVPMSLTPQNNSRKRPQPYTHDFFSGQCGDKEEMEECHAAMILMKLSHSPKNAEKWYGSSPGSSSSSGSSWSSGSSSPPLSDDGHAGLNTSAMLNDPSARIRTTSVSTSDEGIVVDFKEAPRKKRVSPFEVSTEAQQIGSQFNTNKSKFRCTWKGCKHIEHTPKKIERHIRNVHLGNKKARRSVDYDESCSENDHEEEFYYTEIEDEDDDCKTPSPTSPPTLSHRDMARPPHEDPEYQRKIVGNFKQGRVNQQQQLQQNQGQHLNNSKTVFHGGTYLANNNSHTSQQMQSNCVSTSLLNHDNYWQSSSVPVVQSAQTAISSVTSNSSQQLHQNQQTQQQSQFNIKHARSSPRPSQSTAPYPSPTYHHNYSSSPNTCISSNSHGNVNSNTGNSQSSSITPNNSGANNMLQQLSHQNITVTAHHTGAHHNQPQPQPQQQLPAVTITPNYTNQQSQQQLQQIHGHQQSTQSSAAGTIVTISTAQVHQQSQQQQQTSHHQQQQHSQHTGVATTTKHTPNSPNRRTRGENKKCRKVYGMERRDLWCTQCRWKKACTRFGD